MKRRSLETRFWKDSYIQTLSSKGKLLFNYLLMNEYVNIVFIYELPENYISLETGLTIKEIQELKRKFQKDKKFLFKDNWIKIINADKYENYVGEKNETAKKNLLKNISSHILDYFNTPIDTPIDRVPIGTSNQQPIINNKKPNNIKTYTKDNLTLEQVAEKILIVFNQVMGTNHKNIKVFINNLEKCLEIHEPREIAEAIEQIKYDKFWRDVATPEKIFRQSKDGQPKDYIEDLLNLKKENYVRR